MKIAVKLQGILRDHRPAGAKTDLFEIMLDEPAMVRHAVEYFKIPPQKVHAAFLNDELVGLDTPLHDGDRVRLFPPVVGGAERVMRVFIAGIMQGSRRENTIDDQDYRRRIGECLQSNSNRIEIVDPFELHPNSVEYGDDAARQTLIDLAQVAGRADVVIAYVPEASMGTALEMWEAYRSRRPVFTISPMIHNWVVKGLSIRVFETIDQFCAFVSSGDFERTVRAAQPVQSAI
jgi:sulfur carrier protein ThiS